MAGDICDCCNKSDLKVKVLCSALGAWSFAYCNICYSMGAEPKFMVDGTVETLGLNNIDKNVLLTYYDSSTDSYKDVRKGDVLIIFKDNTKIKTRDEVIKKLLERHPGKGLDDI